jgi:hypothetical protein
MLIPTRREKHPMDPSPDYVSLGMTRKIIVVLEME